ncbi:kinesin-like protein KIN-14I [Tanacetum coccineum]|uniref:Kinesin-like protein KIN-14I n=1 Tax=Tanacetum coccineum TaxID=301880 RepID=A0ABQ5IEX5_9ASTR
MAGTYGAFDFSVASMVEDILLEHGEQLCEVNTTSNSDAKISTKRYEATRWLRKSVGVVAAKDLPAEPSEQNFRLGLRSGIILCKVLNKIERGAIPKVEEAPCDSVIIPDGAPLSSCPYFENIINFLSAIEERGLPTFEASDLEQGGKLSRVVNCVLALKSYGEWKKAGAHGTFKFDGNPKPSPERKQMVVNMLDMAKCGNLWKDVEDKPLHMRVRDLLSDQKREDIPVVVEIVLSKLTEEFERRLAIHKEKMAAIALLNAKNEPPRTRKEDIKPSPRESKPRTPFKKQDILKAFNNVINNEKEESETKKTEETKSFGSIVNEMRKKTNSDIKKPSADTNNDPEKKTNSDIKKPSADLNNDPEKKTTTFAKKFAPDTYNETEKKPTIFTKKVPSDTNSEIGKTATKDTMKATTDDMNKDMEDNVTSDVNNEVEEEDDDDDDDDLDTTSDIDDETDDKEVIDDNDESTTDTHDETEKKKQMERKMALEKKKEMQEKREMERKKEMETRAAEEKKEEEYYNWVNAESERLKSSHMKQQRLVDYQHKELQALKNTFSTAKADMELLKTNYQQEVDNLGKHLNSLAQAAAGYRKVVDENRKLYNQVQDLKGSIRVYCRVRPAFGPPKPSCVDCMDEVTMAVITPAKSGKETRKSFTFNRVFNPQATQASVYTDTQPLIRSVLDGYNVCIFAYGQTGSGKTFTMTGPEDLTPELMGVNYRALNDLFDIQQQRKNMIAYEVHVQMLEIYNEQVRDLLNTDGSVTKYPLLYEIRLGTANGINVPDAALVPVSKTEDVVRLMNLGHKNRAVGSTAMNARSSRSHSCVTVHVSGKDLTSGSTVRGCMHLVDLAGSERADKTEATGDRLKEATHINKSLSALGDVIACLSQKNAHVPYRNSKLTLLLQDALGGQAKTLMFIHVSPDPDTVGETVSTLKFAERVSTVELGAAKSNNDDGDLKKLKEQVAFLKATLAKEGGDGQDGNIDDGGDDEDDAASESSEADSQSQKVASGAASKLKKPSAAAAKSPQSRASPSTSTTRKPASASSSATKTTRPAAKKPGNFTGKECDEYVYR